jgi:hypothetical protein
MRKSLVAMLFSVGAALSVGAGADVVVLKGGTVVPLKEPVVRRGNTAYITRADGTLLSVPVSEIDREATAAANRPTEAAAGSAAATAPAASTPAEAARAKSEAPKARVRITDADVSHPLDLDAESGQPKTEADSNVPGPRVEVADYTQEMKGEALVVRGSLRNVGQAPAESLRMNVTAIDDKGLGIEGATASLSKSVLEPGKTVEFQASLNVGQKVVTSLRFAPQWAAPRPPPPPAQAGATGSVDPRTGRPPAPRPTPYGRGTLYAPPVANAPSQAPADGKTGYIPGASNPDQQPRPPSR